MSKLLEINTVCNGSTGRIMGDIARKYISEGNEAICLYGRRKGYKDIPCIKVGGWFSFFFHIFLTTVFDKQGYGSYFKTKKMIKIIKKENPNIIHLHNIHGYYLNFKVLFNYLKNEYKGKIYWTFHDCWPFTGHCPHFILANCSKWKSQCYSCPNKKLYPTSLFFDNSRKNYLDKKEYFSDVKNLIIIVPSDWVNNLVSQSFLKGYDCITISNGVDSSVFHEDLDKSILKQHNIPSNKKIILGVANIWDKRKGLGEFIELSKEITDEYIIVLIGLNKAQITKMPKNIIGIERTSNQKELAKLYSNASIFINPSKEETFSLVAIESLLCKTPIVVYSNTPMVEFITNENNGIVIDDKITFKKIESFLNKYDKKKINVDKRYTNESFLKNTMDLYKEGR